jgi:hypothetical protein
MSMQTIKRSSQEALSTDADVLISVASAAKSIALTKMSALGDGRSLASMLTSRRSGLHSLHMQFAAQMDQRRKVSFEAEKVTEEPFEPPMKRRRFQRRNSKTAAMLFSSMSSIASSDLESEKEKSSDKIDTPSCDPWDSSLEIAEELVRQLKLRRQILASKAV